MFFQGVHVKNSLTLPTRVLLGDNGSGLGGSWSLAQRGHQVFWGIAGCSGQPGVRGAGRLQLE